jgi:hypothetical protein
MQAFCGFKLQNKYVEPINNFCGYGDCSTSHDFIYSPRSTLISTQKKILNESTAQAASTGILLV